MDKSKPTDWIQAVGIVFGIGLAVWQLFVAVDALQQSAEANTYAAESNRLAMVAAANDILTQVNLTAIQLDLADHQRLDESQTGYTPRERLHLLRLQYLDRMHRLHESNLLDQSTWVGEQSYAVWLTSQPFFKDMWTRNSDQPGGALRDHYRATFQELIDEALAN